MAREVISRVQALRRSAELDVSDRIALTWSTGAESIRAAMTAHTDLIAGEVLATTIVEGAPDTGTAVEVDGEAVWLTVGAAD